ncbi:uncharacterized protein LOC124594692 [Schistocerca americana]|uniref:uncharacterized protein LOC124594692 n=1 Tax=Schistocerca americana TaxID=7009 RepID=UPI001F4F424A|nr:uncharacterized protein LOC124594692 [Schistocerca americana]
MEEPSNSTDDSDYDDNPEETEPIVSEHDTLSEQSVTENYSDVSSDPCDEQQRSNYFYGKNQQKYSDKSKAEHQILDLDELLAFLGLLMYSSVFKSNHENELFFLNCLRFDDFQTKKESVKVDKMAAVSCLFRKIVENFQKYFSLGTCATVDEQQVSFCGKVSFVVYMPKKPFKYGLKIMSLCDARTSFFYNGYIYTGKGSDGNTLPDNDKKLMIPTQSLLRLCKPIYGSNHKITAKNSFISIQTVEELRKIRCTFVVTLKKNNRDIPQASQPNKHMPVGSSSYGFTQGPLCCRMCQRQTKQFFIT